MPHTNSPSGGTHNVDTYLSKCWGFTVIYTAALRTREKHVRVKDNRQGMVDRLTHCGIVW